MIACPVQDTFIDIYYIYFLKLDELAALKQAYDVNYDQVVQALSCWLCSGKYALQHGLQHMVPWALLCSLPA